MVAPKIQILMAIGVVLGIVQAGPIDYNNHVNKSPTNNMATCTTPQCRLTAAGIVSDMDPTVDPCQDFSKFTCGGFYAKHEIPAGKPSIGPFDILRESNARILRLIVDPSLGQAPKAPAGDIAAQRNIKKLQDLFNSCMDEKAILKAGRKPLVDEIQKIIKSLPASGSRPDKKILAHTLGQIVKYGFQTPGFISLYAGSDNENPLINVLTIYEDGLGLRDEAAYKDEGRVKKYRETIAAMFQTILGDEDVTNQTQPLNSNDIKKEWLDAAKEVVDFEIQLTEIKTPRRELWDSTKNRNPRTVQQLNAMIPSIDWSVFLREAFPPGLKYTGPIIVSSLPYLTKLETLLQKTSSKTLQRYFSWVLTRSLSGNLAQPYKQPKTNFDSITSAISANATTERWSTCVSTANTNLVHITGHYFVKATFKGNSRQEVLTIVDNVIASYEKTFPTLAWLDNKTRAGAIKKLKAIVKSVGYSTENPDDVSAKSLDAFYKDYTVVKKDYFGNQLRYMRWAAANAFSQLRLPVDRLAMDMSLTTVNAYYNPSSNSIYIPAGILQLPFFNIENPEYVNYGSMGVVGGHEIGHAFDNNGRHYDSIGRRANWWTNATSQAFEEKAQCFVNQYGNFTIKGPQGEDHNLDGEMTLGENLADNGGIKMAFRIWQSRHKSDPKGNKYKNFKLPGLDKYTPEQLFFISYGRLWCTMMTPDALVDYVGSNPHSPGKWRINGVAQNSPDFAKAFKCKTGTPMNPAKKCEVW
ncbi:hypothetical protein BG015_000773 [Linnemannia schmuckeri]|uniref:Uncharacterized protein n=1 Tax=Linnemannia schmuckeri TaxID=64567 RepID=A0A9P5S3V7_9FUNG|nr:hypothetical protein BG015_000773 [Linnemannia schmuckeri]